MFCMDNVAKRVAVLTILAGFAVATAQAPTPKTVCLVQDNAVCVLRSGSTQPQKLGTGRFPALSPDGKWVAYFQETAGKNLLKIVGASSGKEATHPSFRPSGYVTDLVWSPKGSTLAVGTSGDASYRIQLIPVSNGKNGATKTLPATVYGKTSVFALNWWPDGKSLLFHDLNTLFRVGLDGKLMEKTATSKIVGKPNSVDSLASFVPNPVKPTELAYTASVPGTAKFEQTFHEPNSALFVWNRTTGQRRRLTPPDMVATSPVWHKDGKGLVFCGYREPHYKQLYPFRIYTVRTDGTGLKELCKGEDPSL